MDGRTRYLPVVVGQSLLPIISKSIFDTTGAISSTCCLEETFRFIEPISVNVSGTIQRTLTLYFYLAGPQFDYLGVYQTRVYLCSKAFES